MKSKNRASTRANLPSGIVTFLFSDIEGSTKLWEQHPEAMQSSLARHDAILRAAVETNCGWIVKQRGDGIHAVFAVARDALEAALDAQRALQTESWRTTGPLHVRIALHTGAAEERDGDYFGSPVNRAARLLACGHGGQILLSLAIQELVRDHLSENISLRDLGEHRLKDLIRPERIFQVVAPDLPADFPPLVTLDSRPNNLPAQTTPLVGRDKELAAVEQLVLREDVREVTLNGPGGTGKTRLGLQTAADLVDRFEHGVYFVNLAPVRDPAWVASAIAQVLDIRESGEHSLVENLKTFLREKQILLLLDNFEQIVPAALVVADLLAACPRLKILVTSREVLHLRGEHEFFVPPLALPDPKDLPDVERMSQYAALTLFIQRVRAVKPDFAVTNQNAPAVAEICARLDGLPLAIELAAARCKFLSPPAILARLDNRLTWVTSGARDLPARHQTLRETITWSFDLLDADEKILFARLGVFVGGCTMEAIESVCGVDVFAHIESLVNKSLLRLEELSLDESRVTMLETIREFALEQLIATGEDDGLRRKHAEYYLALAERAEPELLGGQQAIALAKLERDLDNLRAVLEWTLGCGEAEIAIRLAGATGRFWHMRGYLSEGRRWHERALANPQLDPAHRAKALKTLGTLVHYQGDYSQATAIFEEALALQRRLGHKGEVAAILNNLGIVAQKQDDLPRAVQLLEEALALRREEGNQRSIGTLLGNLGMMAYLQGDDTRTQSLFEESLVIHRELGDKEGVSIVLNNLGEAALNQGEYAMSASYHEESLAIKRELGDKIGIAFSLSNLGKLAGLQRDYARGVALIEQAIDLFRELGSKYGIAFSLDALGYTALRRQEYPRSAQAYAESLKLRREIGNREGIASCLEGFACLACAQSQFIRAARLYGAAETLRQAIAVPMPTGERARHECNCVQVRNQLGDERFESTQIEGRAMSLEQAIAYALEKPA